MEVAFRDVRLTRSKDFVHWTEPEMIIFSDGDQNIQHYTNQIYKYPGTNIFIGTPVRYLKHDFDDVNFKYLPAWGGQRQKLINAENRVGTVSTDCVLITSRDGLHFDRCNEAFMAPGIEKTHNWVYGECYLSHHAVETVSDENENVNELSFYVGEGHRGIQSKFVRYTLRLDGYFSWHGNYSGGEILTKEIIFTGSTLKINFATSALGYVRISICDEEGRVIDGFESAKLFGNSLSRPVDFAAPLSALSGKKVKLKIELKDADLYSFMFE
jgi:hypothetical protein